MITKRTDYQRPKANKQPRPEILLHPNIPKPMHEVSPRTIMGQAWWDIVRREAYLSTNYHCAACGVHKSQAKKHQWLEAHEVYDIDYEKGTMTFVEIVPLCHYCHNCIHSGHMAMLVDAGEMTKKIMNEIKKHGEVVLKGIKKEKKELKSIAPWSKWRMVFDGKEYPPKYKSFDAWFDKYARSN